MSGFRNHSAISRWLGALLIAGMIGAAPRTASAVLTVEDLTGNAVAGVGPYYQDVKEAIDAFAAGDFARATERLESARKNTPLLPPVDVMLARLYFDSGQAAGGFAALERAVRSVPDDPEALVLLGEIALASGRLTEAGMVFEKATPKVEAFRANSMRRQDLQKRVLNGGALIAENDGNHAEAERKLNALLVVQSDSAAVHERLGRVLFRMNKGREAYEQFKLAAAGDKNAPPPELAMAALFTDKTNAEKWIAEALRHSGEDARTHFAVGQLRLRENQLDEAQKHAAKALQLAPESYEANLLAGMVARMQADYPAAAGYLGKAHLLAPADAAVVNHLALVLIELPDEPSRQRALQFAQLNAQREPNMIDVLATLGWINYRLKRFAEAERTLTAAYKAASAAHANQLTPEMAYYLAVIAKDRGRTDEAIKRLEEAVSNERPFAYRVPAQKLLAELRQASAAAPLASP